ncbi:MAG: hypothetical protein MK171_00530 [Pirellulales bacterium]|nr:hypothetical protein [Pirellulales bacterium]
MIGLIAAPPFAAAQNFKKLEPKLSGKQAKALSRGFSQMLRDPDAFEAGKARIDEYFKGYFFPAMTNYGPNELGQLAKYRETLLKTVRGATVDAAQQQLTDLSLKAGIELSRGNFHPAVRYNGTLIIGLLDKRVAANGPPEPLPAATIALVDLLEQDKAAGGGAAVRVPASVKAAAWVGLERHARFGIQADYRERVTQAALALVADTEPQEELSRPVHNWMKCMAARVLAQQSADGPTAEVHSALTELIADNQMDLEDRCCAAELLQKIDYKTGGNWDGAATVLALGQLAQDVLEEEAEESVEFEKKRLERAPAFRSPRRRSTPRRGGTRIDGPEYPRSRLVDRLTSITAGANSLAKGLLEASEQNLQLLTAALEQTITLVVDKDSGDLLVTQSVKELKSTVDTLVNGWKPPAAEAAEAGKEDAADATG